MGCDCPCHEKLEALRIRGCCFNCEMAHDPLGWTMDALKDLVRADQKAKAPDHYQRTARARFVIEKIDGKPLD